MRNRRVFILLLDSLGIGASLDASKWQQQNADTFGHIVEYCAAGKANNENRRGPLHIPNLCDLGLAHSALASTGKALPFVDYQREPQSQYGYAVETSFGKDTPSGHWEIAGVPVLFDWGYFPPDHPSFPKKLLTTIIQQSNIPGVLGNKHASGTEIINELGEQHIKTGKPIVYTSADSVFQIAAHEEYFGLDKLYNLCHIAREYVNPYNIGRVIARPFIGESGHFTRTGHRRDFSMPPPHKTLLDYCIAKNGTVIAIGKTADIFAHQGISQQIKAHGNDALFDATLTACDTAPHDSIVFTNFVDFDSTYGHRRDVAGYAHALEQFDQRLAKFIEKLHPGDRVLMTADHGCDPTWPGSDHTREHVPVLFFGPNCTTGFIGRRDTFADMGQTIASYLDLSPLSYGNEF